VDQSRACGSRKEAKYHQSCLISLYRTRDQVRCREQQADIVPLSLEPFLSCPGIATMSFANHLPRRTPSLELSGGYSLASLNLLDDGNNLLEQLGFVLVVLVKTVDLGDDLLGGVLLEKSREFG
jgi:hypothetical protein